VTLRSESVQTCFDERGGERQRDVL
jgi:hypothetical protein